VYIGLGLDIYALNARTGAKLWSYNTGLNAMPVVVSGVVYVGSAQNVFAFSLKHGRE
jgi:outer membrane protein assembly factor BamB